MADRWGVLQLVVRGAFQEKRQAALANSGRRQCEPALGNEENIPLVISDPFLTPFPFPFRGAGSVLFISGRT
jgi:hypothetical protein